MKIKSLITVLIIICMVSVMVSCKQNTNGTDAPVPTDGTPVPSEDESAQQKLTIPVDPDFFLLCCENSDFVIDFSASYARQVCYQLISAFPIASERECSISFDKIAIPVYMSKSEVFNNTKLKGTTIFGTVIKFNNDNTFKHFTVDVKS